MDAFNVRAPSEVHFIDAKPCKGDLNLQRLIPILGLVISDVLFGVADGERERLK